MDNQPENRYRCRCQRDRMTPQSLPPRGGSVCMSNLYHSLISGWGCLPLVPDTKLSVK